MKNSWIDIVIAMLLILTNQVNAQKHVSSLLQYDKQIDGIISQMTLDEKVNMLPC